MKKRPIVLCILDGYGLSERVDGNAVKLANGSEGPALLASLLELDGPRAPVVAVFSDTCKESPALGEAMIKIVIEKYDEVGRDVKNEAALLAARTFLPPAVLILDLKP